MPNFSFRAKEKMHLFPYEDKPTILDGEEHRLFLVRIDNIDLPPTLVEDAKIDNVTMLGSSDEGKPTIYSPDENAKANIIEFLLCLEVEINNSLHGQWLWMTITPG
jgi:hypothetical protein